MPPKTVSGANSTSDSIDDNTINAARLAGVKDKNETEIKNMKDIHKLAKENMAALHKQDMGNKKAESFERIQLQKDELTEKVRLAGLESEARIQYLKDESKARVREIEERSAAREMGRVELEAKKLEVRFQERKLLKRNAEHELEEKLRRKINRTELKLELSGIERQLKKARQLVEDNDFAGVEEFDGNEAIAEKTPNKMEVANKEQAKDLNEGKR